MAFIPIGSSNDLCSSLGIESIDHAMEYIVKAETVKMDTIKVLIDHDSDEMPPLGLSDEDILRSCRYMTSNSRIGLSERISRNAQPWNLCCTNPIYKYGAMKEKINFGFVQEAFELEIDGVNVNQGEAI